MIGTLKGTIDFIGETWLIVDIQGVGYQVHCSARTLASLPPVGDSIALFIETYVREKEIKLYGFTSELEKRYFLLLQEVQGVGAKVALVILSTLSVNDLANAIAMQDKDMIAQTPGIGKKVATRITSELKDKISAQAGVVLNTTKSQIKPSEQQDAISALTNLGYSLVQASQAVRFVLENNKEKKINSATLIKNALQELVKKN